MNCFGIDARSGAAVRVEGDAVIGAVEPLISPPPDLPLLAPGFIDLQVNGFAGADFNQPATPHEAIQASLRALFRTGVTRFLPTIITGPPGGMAGALRNLAAAREALPDGPAMEGFHVEGPHISAEEGPRGAHPAQWVRPPDVEEYRRWQEASQGQVRMVTLSPEWPGAPAYIEALVREGVVAAIGHTSATAAQIEDAVRAGATISTHLGNGAHALIPRHPNYLWEQLANDRLAASFIVDGIHLPAAFLKVALRAKGIERSVLITDAVTPAACQPGFYRLGEMDVELHANGSVTLRGTTRLAGSALKMDCGIENLMRLAGLSLVEALAMTTRNPARVARISGRQRGLTPGDRADLVAFRFDPDTKSIRIERTWLGGKLVYSSFGLRNPETTGCGPAP
ncbi:MAG: amidohydrolase family protein [Acidobacteria bacterium]|nr:amidohydrolase family protein [Acidobacteriota bacterium]